MTSKGDIPSILIVSNNPLSDTRNNGKTLMSFFKDYPKDRLSQLYFNQEVPAKKYCNSFFQITDQNNCIALSKFSNQCGSEIFVNDTTAFNLTTVKHSRIITLAKQSYLFRLSREVIWGIGKWKTRALEIWLRKINPEHIFFCAGDSIFAYKVVEYILKRYSCKLSTYITDDYILPRLCFSPSYWIRRRLLIQNMRSIINKSDFFFTISDEMRAKYLEIFKKSSICILNIPQKHDIEGLKRNKNIVTQFIYAGGLSFKRWKTLIRLVNAIANYNYKSKRKAFLSIYSTSKPSDSICSRLNVAGSSKFLGTLDSEAIQKEISESDILVHVESFDKAQARQTCLSISTKITEYLSYHKPILAIGPAYIASMKFLETSAFCIIDTSKIEEGVYKLIVEENLRKKLTINAANMYEKYKEKYPSRYVIDIITEIGK